LIVAAFQIFGYTDDTAMTKSVAESLIQMKSFDAKDMAKRFTLEYYRQPKRGYGNNVVDVFANLRIINYDRPYEPARMQFAGYGSYGNGGAMRISPIALFGFHLSDEQLIEMASNCAQITHANRNGYNGAILQCLAIHQALHTQCSLNNSSFDVKHYLNVLIEKMDKIENNTQESEENASQQQSKPFSDKLLKIKQILESDSQGLDLTSEEVAVLLGNEISALKSVPVAIYSVLRAQKPLNDFESDNPFVRTLYFALSLGGDTDTIASMACSIAGALYGIDSIPDVLQKHCEDIDVIAKYSENLYNLVANDS
jgi:poly(ADP-ribose) glycohydrolase ARH3